MKTILYTKSKGICLLLTAQYLFTKSLANKLLHSWDNVLTDQQTFEIGIAPHGQEKKVKNQVVVSFCEIIYPKQSIFCPPILVYFYWYFTPWGSDSCSINSLILLHLSLKCNNLFTNFFSK